MTPLVGRIGGGEGADRSFAPDRCLADGETVAGSGWALRALHTPGHFGNHMCFQHGDMIFSGDLVMGRATSLVSPPDGDMAAFMASLDRLAGLGPRILLPGHGDPVGDPAGRIAELIAHRRGREAQILAALGEGPATLAALTARIYHDTPAALLPAASRNVLAHLVDLAARGRVDADPDWPAEAPVALAGDRR